jgi:flagellar biosynthesis protein FlhG
LVNAPVDQAEGLRRMLSAPLPGLCTVLSADDDNEKDALMKRLAASMSRRGREVILVDGASGATAAADAAGGSASAHTLLDVARGRASLDEAAHADAGGYRRARLGTRRDDPALNDFLKRLAAEQARVLVDATLDEDGRLPLPLLAEGEVVVQLSGSEASIRTAYEMLRSLKDQCAHRSVSLLVTAADPVHARRVHSNLFQAASRYLALSVRSIVAQEVRHV